MRSSTLSSVASLMARAWPGREVVIEDQHLGVELHRAQHDLVELAAADQELGVDGGAALHHEVEHLHAGGAAQLLELADAGLAVDHAADGDVDHQGAVLAPVGGGDPAPAAVLGLERGDELGEVGDRGVGRLGRQLAPRPVGGAVDQQVADVEPAGAAAGVDADGAHQVEAEQREVGEVVAGQRLAAEVGVDQAQAAEAAGGAAQTADVGQHDLGRIADEDVRDLAAAIDQHADLAKHRRRDLGEEVGELGAHHLRRCDAPAIDSLERLQLAGLQARGVARHLF